MDEGKLSMRVVLAETCTGRVRAVPSDAREMPGGIPILLDYHVARHLRREAVATREGADMVPAMIAARGVAAYNALVPVAFGRLPGVPRTEGGSAQVPRSRCRT